MDDDRKQAIACEDRRPVRGHRAMFSSKRTEIRLGIMQFLVRRAPPALAGPDEATPEASRASLSPC